MKTVLSNEGHTVEFINYIPSGEINNVRVYKLIDKIVDKLKNKLIYQYAIEEQSGKLFDQFIADNLPLSKRVNTQTDLENLSNSYDCIICGSDQIWSPFCYNPHYFLDFVADNNTMCAYAPSIGTEKIEDQYIREDIHQLTRRFKYLSVREKSGATLLYEFGENPQVVLDPTLLLTREDWVNISCNTEISDKYLLLYLLSPNNKYVKVAHDIASNHGLTMKVIPVFIQDRKNKNCITKGVGPSEFISLIKNASFVCTDSFHGTVFSLIFNKQFCTFERFSYNDKKNQNTRIYNLLNSVCLQNRIYKGQPIEKLGEKIKYSKANERLDCLRKRSLEFLYGALDDIYNYTLTKVDGKPHILENHSLCCGCGSCKAVCPINAISIGEDDSGFLRASVDEDICIRCGKCTSVCPFQGSANSIDLKSGKLVSYKDNSEKLLNTSSSGGFATRLAILLHTKGYAIIGSEYQKEKQKAVHTIVLPTDNREDLLRFAGSKYLQSDFSTALYEANNLDYPLAFFGTPCQIAGARKLLSNRHDAVYIDLICHGVPTQFLINNYLKYVENKKAIDTSGAEVIFRNKKCGWREIYIYIENSGKSYSEYERKDPFMMFFRHGLCYAHNCYECRWRDGSAADIRIGDYWGDRYIHDKNGVSMVLATTDTGIKIVEQMRKFGRLEDADISDYFSSQQTKNHPEPVFWNKLIADLKTGKNFEELINEFAIPYENYEHRAKKISSIYGKAKSFFK